MSQNAAALPGEFGRVAVAVHYLFHGAGDELEDFLRSRARVVVYMAHPLMTRAGDSQVRVYKDGKLESSMKAASPGQPLRYFRELASLVRWARPHAPLDLFVGTDSLLSLAGLWLRRRGAVRRVVLYTFDFVPQRFRNRVLNFVYHWIDRYVVRNVDVVWNVSPAIEIARHDRDGDRPTAPQIVVPIGARIERIERLPLSQSDPLRLVFVSHLLEKQGLQLAIEAMPAIREAVPGTTLLVIGDGPYGDHLRQMAHDRGLDDAIEFAGQQDDHVQLERTLTRCALSLAPYVPDPASYTRFADPSKIKLYLSCGLPIVMTDMFWNARQIAERGAGKIIDYDAAALTKAVSDYLRDAEALHEARLAAADFARDFAWDHIFATALARTAQLTGSASIKSS